MDKWQMQHRDTAIKILEYQIRENEKTPASGVEITRKAKEIFKKTSKKT